MPEDEETPRAPGWLGEGILVDGVDPGAARRAAIREANARRQQAEVDRVAQRGQERAERPQRATVPGKPAPPLRGHRAPTLARVHHGRPGPAAGCPALERLGKGPAPVASSSKGSALPLSAAGCLLRPGVLLLANRTHYGFAPEQNTAFGRRRLGVILRRRKYFRRLILVAVGDEPRTEGLS